jgi:hypothetical protein
MTGLVPIATFSTLDEAESALDWIGIDAADGDGGFEGTLRADDRERLEAAVEAADTPGPVRDLARALLAAWSADGTATLDFAIGWRDAP